jgi:gamma-glutamyltranspeptidase
VADLAGKCIRSPATTLLSLPAYLAQRARLIDPPTARHPPEQAHRTAAVSVYLTAADQSGMMRRFIQRRTSFKGFGL